MSHHEDQAAWEYRCQRMEDFLAGLRADMMSQHLGEISGEFDQDKLDDRAHEMYQRLEALPKRDLSLAVVLLLYPDTTAEAQKFWRQLQTARPEDIR